MFSNIPRHVFTCPHQIFFQVFCFIKTYNYTSACETNTESGAIARVGASTPRRPPHALATGKWLRHAARPQDTVASTLTCSLLSPSVSHRQPSSKGSGLTLTLPSLRNTKAGIFRTQLGGSNLLFGATEAAVRSLCQSAVSTRKADSGPGRWRGGRQRSSSSACLFLRRLRRAQRMSGVQTELARIVFLVVDYSPCLGLLRYM